MYHLLRQAARRHAVYLLSYAAESGLGSELGPLEQTCAGTELLRRPGVDKRREQLGSLLSIHSYQQRAHFSEKMQDMLDRRCRDWKIDLVVVEFSQMGYFRIPAGIPWVLDQHNVEADLLRRMAQRGRWSIRRLYNHLEAAKFTREEKRIVNAASAISATSVRDRELMACDCPRAAMAEVIENGVDCSFFEPSVTVQPRPNSLIFVGATHYFPNEDGMVFFMDQIFPLVRQVIPEVTLKIVGGRPSETLLAYHSEAVEVTGFVDDVRPYMWDSAVFVVPLRMGGGTRLKVVEALAAHVPVVSTALGAEGIEVESGRHLLLADEPRAFADAVIRLLKDRDYARQLCESGNRLMKDVMDWDVIGKRWNRLLENTAKI
jgi:glycosyltransferase involved in cell wall biosynthesis